MTLRRIASPRPSIASLAQYLFSASAVVVGALCSSSVAAMDTSGQVLMSGQPRTYSIHVPDTAATPLGFPLVLAFHGGGMQGEGMRMLTHLDRLADERNFIVVYPNGVDKHWNDGRSTIRNPQDDVGFIAALIDRLKQQYTVDSGAIFATGISNGALFAERLGCELSDRVAGIAPVAGSLPAELASRCNPTHAVAVMQIDGTADPIMPFRGGRVEDFGGRGEGGDVLGVEDTVAFWAHHDGCGAAASDSVPQNALLDRTRVVRTTRVDCTHGAAVTQLTIVGGGHTWPGGPQYAPRSLVGTASRQIDASGAMIDFFLSQRRSAR